MHPALPHALLLALLAGCEGVWKPYLDGQPAEDCATSIDDDKDGLINGDDPDCWPPPAAAPLAAPVAADPAPAPTVVPPVEVCANPGDEDGDSLADCADPDCAADPACQAPAVPPAP